MTQPNAPSFMSDRDDVIMKLGQDRRLAHAVIFAHRHPDATPDFHLDMIDLWHSSTPKVLIMALREGAKSTVGEEEIILDAMYQQFKNAVIVGETFDRAADRLRAIKHEIEYNEYLTELFEGQKGSTWNEDKIVLQNGVCIQAKGRDQSFRGIKHLDWRPDFLWMDDYEDHEAVKTPEARDQWKKNFMAVILPALDKRARVRITGTPLDEECLLMQLEKERRQDGMPAWVARRYPIEYVSQTGERVPIWPARYPIEHIDALKHSYEEQGLLQTYMMEYMVQASNPELKKFKPEHIRIVPRERTWQPTIAVYDPARTTKKESSAMTGHVVASWVGNRLVIWESDGRFLMPDEMIADMFRVEERWQPVEIGVEETGLNEWIMQPLRHEQTKRRVLLPINALNAPKGKDDFIGSLQPFFAAGEVELACEMPELRKQLLAFPTGRKDVPNALAYMLLMRPGTPMYDGFGHLNVVEDLPAVRARPFWLAVNADQGVTTGVLCQHIDGAIWLLADWVREGDPREVLKDIVTDASMLAAKKIVGVAGPQHFKDFDTIGLRPAAQRIPLELKHGGELAAGRQELTNHMRAMVRGQPALLISSKASWALRGFAGGYARQVVKGGGLALEARKNVYRVVCEGLEAFAALLPRRGDQDIEDTPHYAYTERGVRYMTALPRHG